MNAMDVKQRRSLDRVGGGVRDVRTFVIVTPLFLIKKGNSFFLTLRCAAAVDGCSSSHAHTYR